MHTHTHKVWLQYKICTKWCNPTYTCFPCTWVLRLASKLCTPVCFWACSHVVNNPCSNFKRRRRRKKEFKKKKTWNKRNKKILFYMPLLQSSRMQITLQHYHRQSPFCYFVPSFRSISLFHPTSVVVSSNVRLRSIQHPSPSIHPISFV
jgi:hypothetical protein